ncbi:trypsin-like peptidase domain-containing protein [Enterobacteriaceae endosymbiont of Neohaemonia nigricornis]|uniref:trypsin-like peptidase domain-containing protein n=1 Tax=Enterobacteriaceae endosymbiont of Neohaemonia nigricornis TaxID=2675792 RepID=UPI0014491F67|nr:trypsin-like peptidase domain-containing protein [Enterobacteriaceae endosymbiont of Neohaemonia nigricornis]QJC30388.1 PDZ domain-containing protein [Enterobacteriaceae endosymbiont of Neohaemonia nigricornis]
MKKIKIFLYLFIMIIMLPMYNIQAKQTSLITNNRSIYTVNHMPNLTLATILSKVIPSVVNINIDGSIVTKNFVIPEKIQKISIEQHFCDVGSKFKETPLCVNNENILSEKFHAIGSGVIINAKKGLIITNNHVIENANSITVELYNGEIYPAKLIGQDEASDVAVLQIKNAKQLKSIKIANSDQLKVGDYTIAIGNPFGLNNTVTTGIISALNRSGNNTNHFEDFIQTDAAINHGSSGGALVNLQGNLIGINTAIVTPPSGGSIGIGFAIPSNTIIKLFKQINKFGYVRHGFLGFSGIDLNQNLNNILKINKNTVGIFVKEVWNKNTKLKAGDVIVAFNGKKINNFMLLRAKVSSYSPGSKIKLNILRKGLLIKNITLTLQNSENISNQINLYGLEGINLTNFYSYKKNSKVIGVKVVKISSNCLAVNAGLRVKDIIIEINNNKIKNIQDIKKILGTCKKKHLVILHVLRNKHDLYLIM